LLTGESGLGKSAALARFVRDFRKEQPDRFLLAHFVGASPRTTSLPTMLHRLTQELQRRFALTLPAAESADEIIRAFQIAITSVPESARVVLVFDALNQLDADDRAETLVWLPERLPASVRVLCSVATDPQRAPKVLTAFGERHFVAVLMEPLTRDERRDIVKAVPKLVAKTLDDRQIDVLLANPATDNPLFLMVTLEELRGSGSFENLNHLIARLPRTGESLTTLFEQVFERLEEDFGSNLVKRVLSLLVCARRGLSGPELLWTLPHRPNEPIGPATAPCRSEHNGRDPRVRDSGERRRHRLRRGPASAPRDLGTQYGSPHQGSSFEPSTLRSPPRTQDKRSCSRGGRSRRAR
jgi:hypothetical protein